MDTNGATDRLDRGTNTYETGPGAPRRDVEVRFIALSSFPFAGAKQSQNSSSPPSRSSGANDEKVHVNRSQCKTSDTVQAQRSRYEVGNFWLIIDCHRSGIKLKISIGIMR